MILLFGTLISLAQYYTNENKVWVFGQGVGINFNTGTPVPFSAPSIGTIEGSASVCNSAGSLLFYTDGTSIWQSTGTLMATVVSPAYPTISTSQAALIVPLINTPGQYYVFSLEQAGLGISGRLWYCVVDMSLGGGLGGVVPGTISTTPFATGLGEKMTAIAGNSCNVWLVVHKRNAAEFLAYEITSAGVNPAPVVSSAGTFTAPSTSGGGVYGQGCIATSPDRAKIALAQYDFSATCRGVELYDFDPNTGIVSNCRVLQNTMPSYGVEFSPDNTKLYTTDEITPGSSFCRLCQYDVTLPTAAAIAASRYIVIPPGSSPRPYSALKLAPDGKIYFASMVPFSPFNMDVIANPNLAGAACGYIPTILAVTPPSYTQLGLPNIVIAPVPRDTSYAAHDTSMCLGPGVILRSYHAGSFYLWSTGVTADSITITTAGNYWVRVINGCNVTVDTFHVSALMPDSPPVISGDTIYCYGATAVPLTATGAGIKWYTGSGATSSTTAPTVNTSAPGTYTFYATQTITCESARDTFRVTVLPRISPAFTYTTNIECPIATVHFTNATTNATSYVWDFGDGSAVATTANPVHTYIAFGTYNVKLTASTIHCTRDTVVTITVDNQLHAAIIATPDTLCAGENTVLTGIATPATAISAYTWQFGDGSIGAGSSTSHLYSDGGVYMVSLLITDTAGCLDSALIKIVVLQPEVAITSPDTVVCVGTSLQLGCNAFVNLPVSPLFSYHWSPAAHLNNALLQSPVYSDSAGATTYTVSATLNPWGCTATDTVRIQSLTGTPITNLTADASIKQGQSVQLDARNAEVYVWKPADGTLNNNNINNPIATPSVTTVYTVYGYDTHGCIDSAFVTVFVDISADECIPLAFTPNGDGLNDVFRPLCISFQKVVEFSIYNRWGERVFYATRPGEGWNGTYKDLPADMGVYFYMLIVDRLGEHIIYKGDVTLIR